MRKRQKSASEVVAKAMRVLQRGLPSGDLDDRGVITELWGIFDHPSTRQAVVYAQGPLRQDDPRSRHD